MNSEAKDRTLSFDRLIDSMTPRRHRSISGDSHQEMLLIRGNNMSHNSSNVSINGSLNRSSNLLAVAEKDDDVDAAADASATYQLLLTASRLRDSSGKSLLHDCQECLATAAAVLDRAQQLDDYMVSMSSLSSATLTSIDIDIDIDINININNDDCDRACWC
jgi:hypothetical protein